MQLENLLRDPVKLNQLLTKWDEFQAQLRQHEGIDYKQLPEWMRLAKLFVANISDSEQSFQISTEGDYCLMKEAGSEENLSREPSIKMKAGDMTYKHCIDGQVIKDTLAFFNGEEQPYILFAAANSTLHEGHDFNDINRFGSIVYSEGMQRDIEATRGLKRKGLAVRKSTYEITMTLGYEITQDRFDDSANLLVTATNALLRKLREKGKECPDIKIP